MADHSSDDGNVVSFARFSQAKAGQLALKLVGQDLPSPSHPATAPATGYQSACRELDAAMSGTDRILKRLWHGDQSDVAAFVNEEVERMSDEVRARVTRDRRGNPRTPFI